jgi:hypothetical protein
VTINTSGVSSSARWRRRGRATGITRS